MITMSVLRISVSSCWGSQNTEESRRLLENKNNIDKIASVCPNMLGRTVCVLADAAAMPAASYIEKFRGEFEAHIEQKCCPLSGARVG